MQPQFYTDQNLPVYTPKKSFWTRKKLIIIGAVLVMFIVGLGVASSIKGSTNNKQSVELMNAIFISDSDTSFKLFDEEFQKDYSIDNWHNTVEAIKKTYSKYNARESPKITKDSTTKTTIYAYNLIPLKSTEKTKIWVEVRVVQVGKKKPQLHYFKTHYIKQ